MQYRNGVVGRTLFAGVTRDDSEMKGAIPE